MIVARELVTILAVWIALNICVGIPLWMLVKTRDRRAEAEWEATLPPRPQQIRPMPLPPMSPINGWRPEAIEGGTQ